MGFDELTGRASRPSGQAFTGRYLVLCRENDPNVTRTLRATAGLNIASSRDFHHGPVGASQLGGADGIYFDRLGVAVTSSAPDQVRPLVASAGANGIMAVERERVVYVLGYVPREDRPPAMSPARSPDQSWRGPGIESLICEMAPPRRERVGISAVDEAAITWGLDVTRAGASSMTGRGVRIAILDTGLNLDHPDFAGRRVVSQSFVDGEAVEDGQSHGTHCVGVAAGPARPGTLPRYGVACEADIYVGKVLNNRGNGNDGNILAGIDWALANGCRVISMSLGSDVPDGTPYSDVYENVARRALAANTLLIAAAGNASNRPDSVSPVGHPANCPSIMAVAAVNSSLQIAPFSSSRSQTEGGAVDIAGPGVEIHSTVPMPGRYKRLSGTSMAAPHVAGIAALYVQANPNASAQQIWQLLVSNARFLDRESQNDVGAGLAQAPV